MIWIKEESRTTISIFPWLYFQLEVLVGYIFLLIIHSVVHGKENEEAIGFGDGRSRSTERTGQLSSIGAG